MFMKPDDPEPPEFEYDEAKSRANKLKHGIGLRHWSAVFSYRAERVRLISVRRSRQEEVAIYESP